VLATAWLGRAKLRRRSEATAFLRPCLVLKIKKFLEL